VIGKCGKYMKKFMYTLCGCYCAYFYGNLNRTVLFCGYFCT